MQPIPPAAAANDERRGAPRVELARRYSIRLDPCDGRAPITCALLNCSVTGMRLELAENITVPDQVKVLVGKLSHNARIVWRREASVGVDFIDEHHSIF
jgi:hypothetical protein